MNTKAITYWICESCDAEGSVYHEPHAGVLEVIELIRAQHTTSYQHRVCMTGLAFVRIIEVRIGS